MPRPRINPNLIFSIIVLVIGVFISYSIIAQAQTENISYPIKELGNCQNETSCHAFCDKTENIIPCVNFAEKHHLISSEEAQRAKAFVKMGQGPAGCKSKDECEAYCNEASHMEVCLDFAEQHNLISQKDLKEAKLIVKALKEGAKLPGNCQGKDQCETYCQNPNHSEECLAFAEKAGFISLEEAEIARKVMPLMMKGETPGGCRSKDECDAYCSEKSHLDECANFALKAGLMKPEEAEIFKKTGGKGPGDCRSKEECEAYCNNQSHRDECFNFAKEHNLIPPEQLKEMQEGMVRMRQGLEQAPPEIVNCLKSTLGPNIIDDIQSGKLTPGPEIGEKIRDCFEKFGHSADPREIFKNAPPEVMTCLKNKLGSDLEKIEAGQMPTPEMGDAMRICFESMKFQHPGAGPSGQSFSEFLKSAPPEIISCLKEKLGDNFSKLQAGEMPGPEMNGLEIGNKIEACFRQFKPMGPPEGMPPKMPSEMMPPVQQGNPLSPQMLNCVKSAIGEDIFKKFEDSRLTPEEAQKIRLQIQSCTVQMQNQNPLPAPIEECVRQAVGNETMERVKEGRATAEDAQKIQAQLPICAEKMRAEFPIAPSSSAPIPLTPMPMVSSSMPNFPIEQENRMSP